MGTVLARGMSGAGMRTDGLFDPALDLSQDSTERTGTAVCNLLLDGKSGDLITGVADMSIGESVSPAHVLDELAARKPKVVAFDANIPAHTMRAVLEAAPSMDFSSK